jgi:hypothetical protein
MFPWIDSAIVALLIPIIVVIGGVGMGIIAIVMNGRQKELAHKERLIAMEKGIPIPEPVRDEKRPAYLSIRAWGLVMFCLGVALVIAIGAAAGFRDGLWGLLPLSIGAGLLIGANLEKRDIAQ